MVDRKTGLAEVVRMKACNKEQANLAFARVLAGHDKRAKTIAVDGSRDQRPDQKAPPLQDAKRELPSVTAGVAPRVKRYAAVCVHPGLRVMRALC
jgi:hypothetical protein